MSAMVESTRAPLRKRNEPPIRANASSAGGQNAHNQNPATGIPRSAMISPKSLTYGSRSNSTRFSPTERVSLK